MFTFELQYRICKLQAVVCLLLAWYLAHSSILTRTYTLPLNRNNIRSYQRIGVLIF